MSQPQPSRTPLVAGNWKLHHTVKESRDLALGLKERLLAAPTGVQIAVAPVFTALSAVGEALSGTPIALTAQDVYWEDKGAFTGEVGPLHLLDVGCSMVIVGHSERREYFGETDETVRRKALAALGAGLVPILCVGETLATREKGEAEPFVVAQVRAALSDMTPKQLAQIVLAYEPIWAIGTGKTASPADAQQMHAAIRAAVHTLCGPEIASGMRILYGGSVKADNAAALMAEADIDGALVGGASLQVDSFSAIVSAAG